MALSIENSVSLPIWKRKQVQIAIGLLCLLSFLQFANTLTHEFAWDDAIVIVKNERVQEGITGIPSLFGKYQSDNLADQYGYRPLTLVSFAIDMTLFGLENPAGFHFMNLLYFALLCSVILLTLLRLFPRIPLWLAFLVMLLFVVHPIHVEVVANVKSRDEIFALLFGIISVNTYLRGYQNRKWTWMLISGISLLLGVLAKESAITFLAVIPLAVMVQEGDLKRKGLSLLPIGIFVLVIGGVFMLTQSLNTQDIENQATIASAAGVYFEAPVMGNSLLQPRTHLQTAATVPVIMLQYLKNFLFPYPLTYYYGFNQLPLTDFGDWRVYLSLLLHLGLLALGILSWKRNRELSFAVGFYFITLSPYLHLVRVLPDTMADRYLFTPSLGLCLLLAVGLVVLLKRISPAKPADKMKLNLPASEAKKGNRSVLFTWLAPFWKNRILMILMGVFVLALLVRTWSRNPVWKDNNTLFSNDIQYLENCSRCHYQYTLALTERYESAAPSEKPAIQEEIIEHLEKAIAITPEAYNSFDKLGEAYEVFGKLGKSTEIYQKMAAQFPEQARPWYKLGEMYWAQSNYSAAIEPLTHATELAPYRQDDWFFLGWSHFHSAEPQSALTVFSRAKELFPNQFRFYHSLSDVYFELNQPESGFEWLLKGHAAAPNDPVAYQMLYLRYFNAGNVEQANFYQQEAIRKGLSQ